MKRLILSLAAVLLLAGTASTQTTNFFESAERSRQLNRDLNRQSGPMSSWTPLPGHIRIQDMDNEREARELDRMRNSQDRGWQGSGSGIRSNDYRDW